MCRVLLCLITVALPAVAAEPWLRLTTPDFELYSSAGEKKGRDTILHFEQVRAFFLKASPVKRMADFPVRIVEFGSDKEFSPYRLNDFAAAYFVATPARDYIVMSEASIADSSIAIHEYMHLIVRHSGLKIPVWLNEGWADVYSTLRPMGKEAAIGDLLPGRILDLERNAWLDFNALTSVDRDSPEYNEASRAGIFYAESWALTHMLYFAPEYEADFGKFVMALHQGRGAAEACQIAWGRSPAQVFADLRSYFERKRIYGRAYEVQLAKEQGEPSVSAVTEFDEKLMLADLIAAGSRRGDAKKAYERLEKEQPDRADLAMSRGYLALQSKDPGGALKFFGKAYDAGEADARMCFQLSLLMRAAKQPPGRIIPVLQRALKSKPDYTDAQIELGAAKIDGRDFAGGIATLMAIPSVTPERAATVFCPLGFAYAETGDLAEARRNAETCRKWAKTPPEIHTLEQLTGFIEARAGEEAAVHPGEKLQQTTGMARNIDCSSGRKRLQIQVGSELKTFDLPEPRAIEILRYHGGTLDFTCGPLKPLSVAVEYAPPRNGPETSAGIVRSLEF